MKIEQIHGGSPEVQEARIGEELRKGRLKLGRLIRRYFETPMGCEIAARLIKGEDLGGK